MSRSFWRFGLLMTQTAENRGNNLCNLEYPAVIPVMPQDSKAYCLEALRFPCRTVYGKSSAFSFGSVTVNAVFPLALE
jgi:hypothetical protein